MRLIWKYARQGYIYVAYVSVELKIATVSQVRIVIHDNMKALHRCHTTGILLVAMTTSWLFMPRVATTTGFGGTNSQPMAIPVGSW